MTHHYNHNDERRPTYNPDAVLDPGDVDQQNLCAHKDDATKCPYGCGRPYTVEPISPFPFDSVEF